MVIVNIKIHHIFKSYLGSLLTIVPRTTLWLAMMSNTTPKFEFLTFLSIWIMFIKLSILKGKLMLTIETIQAHIETLYFLPCL